VGHRAEAAENKGPVRAATHAPVHYGLKAKPIQAVDFAAPLSLADLRAAQNLPLAAFAARWQLSLQDPIRFLRAWPAAFHKDLLQIPVDRLLGDEGLCLGDAHPGNFGFQRLNGKTLYVYNDLDDSGPAPVAFDAVRFFTAVRVFWKDRQVLDDVLEAYVDAVKSPARTESLETGFAPDWDEERREELAEAAAGGRFLLTGERRPVSPAVRKLVMAGVDQHPLIQGRNVLDVAILERKSGGSGGLERYWLLVDTGAGRTIVECKEAAIPGVEAGRSSRPLPFEQRLEVLKLAFWGETSAADHTYTLIAGKRFLVRDRLERKSLDVLPLDAVERKHVLAVQAGILAGIHRRHWSTVKKDEMRSWLKDSSKTLAKRWLTAYDEALRQGR